MKKPILTLLIGLFTTMVFAQNHVIPLWEGTPPLQNSSDFQEEATQQGILRIANVQNPTIEVYLPTKQIATGEAVVIFPGGGYGILAYDWEEPTLPSGSMHKALQASWSNTDCPFPNP